MKKKISFQKGLLIFLMIASFGLSGCSLSGCGPGGQAPGPDQPLTITWWGVGYDEDYFSRAIERFEDRYANIAIDYQKKSLATYEEELVDALASKQGPDVAMINSDRFYQHKEKLAPMTFSEENIEELHEVEDSFLPVVNDLLIEENKLYGFALEVDTLGLFYNQDMFDNARLREPPSDWNEFNKVARQLTKKNNGKIVRAGAAIGTSNNVSNAEDILLTMMLQNGTVITSSDKKTAAFHTSVEASNGQPIYTGRKALEYYTGFSNPKKTNYVWNKKQKEDRQAFADGKVAMIFDYYSQADDIYNFNPELSFDFARIPQIKNSKTEHQRVLGKFWIQAVTNNVENLDWTWHFNKFLAQEMSSSSLIEEAERYKEDVVGEEIFYGQGLIAKTVYKGEEPSEFDKVFKTMINNVASHNQAYSTAIDTGAVRITEIYQQSD